jgi:hypothetical protein
MRLAMQEIQTRCTRNRLLLEPGSRNTSQRILEALLGALQLELTTLDLLVIAGELDAEE